MREFFWPGRSSPHSRKLCNLVSSCTKDLSTMLPCSLVVYCAILSSMWDRDSNTWKILWNALQSWKCYKYDCLLPKGKNKHITVYKNKNIYKQTTEKNKIVFLSSPESWEIMHPDWLLPVQFFTIHTTYLDCSCQHYNSKLFSPKLS